MTKSTRRRPKGVPQLLKHKVRGKAYAYSLFDGVRHSYGAFDEEARRLFAEDLETWKTNGCRWPNEPEQATETAETDEEPAPVTVADLAARHKAAAKAEHDPAWFKRNEPRIRYACDVLVELHGDELATNYGPRKLKALQAHLCALKRADERTPRLTVKTVNERVRTIVAVFKWAVSDELIPPAVLQGLRAVPSVRTGKPGTRSSRKVAPVAKEHYEAVLPYLNNPVRALIKLLWLTGARPGELFGLRPHDINRGDTPWVARLNEHKTAWKAKGRVLHFGAEARGVLEPFLLRPASRPLFSPSEGMSDSNRQRRVSRQRKLYDGDVERYEREKAGRDRQEFTATYDAKSLRKAVLRAVERCNRERAKNDEQSIPAWFPYQLRHAAATRIRKEHGIEASRVLLGHTSAGMTEVYAEADQQRAASIAEQVS